MGWPRIENLTKTGLIDVKVFKTLKLKHNQINEQVADKLLFFLRNFLLK